MSSSSPPRNKHTFAPPSVCNGCWWERKYKDLLALHKKVQMELLKFVAAKRPKRHTTPPVERQDDDHDPELKDLVEMFGGGHDDND